MNHVDYPHSPGTLYDCPACESTCYCVAAEDFTCVHCAVEAEDEDEDDETPTPSERHAAREETARAELVSEFRREEQLLDAMEGDDTSIELSVCIDCIHHLANDECGGCHPLTYDATPGRDPHGDHVPLSKWDGSKYHLVPGGDHHPDCARDRELDCDCDNLGFSLSTCEGCGSTWDGDRFQATAFPR